MSRGDHSAAGSKRGDRLVNERALIERARSGNSYGIVPAAFSLLEPCGSRVYSRSIVQQMGGCLAEPSFLTEAAWRPNKVASRFPALIAAAGQRSKAGTMPR